LANSTVAAVKYEASVQKTEQKKDWILTPGAFRLLLEWLDEGADSGGERYLEMRRRLVAYFDRKNCLRPDELADETLNRVARRLEEQAGEIESETPAKYCYIVARFVFMEYLRAAQKEGVPLDDVLQTRNEKNFAAPEQNAERQNREKMLECLEQCTAKLEPAHRDIITRYYFGEERVKIENRRALAESLGITVNALSIRACRIRDKLESCVGKCAS
jgi:DNA-directed RNA polymerase specialized sigma24 family protein